MPIEVRDDKGNLVTKATHPHLVGERRVFNEYWCQGCNAVIHGVEGLKTHPAAGGKDCGPLTVRKSDIPTE